ncbi:MAG: hypothetical protein JWR85_3181 [Marmoricola sp.]|nr:hypothetical protein [Marmoricola sp.]
MAELFRGEVDGVPCFWVETGRPTLAAQLVFRSGSADEPLPETGWLHVLEHLALHGRGGGALHVNGSVSLLHTAFDSHGPPEAVTRHLSELTRWLSAPSFRELERERNVLRAESNQRGGPFHRALLSRYGAHGPGVVGYDEPGLSRADRSRLRDRAHRVFVRGNCVLMLDGPPPPGMRLHLKDGEFLTPRDAEPQEMSPSAYAEEAGLVLSGVVMREAAATFLPELLERALLEELRGRLGGAYSPWSTYEAVDAHRAVVVAASDMLGEFNAEGIHSAVQSSWRFAAEGVPPEWVADIVAARSQALQDPYAAFGLAVRAGHYWLGGQHPLTFTEVLEELHSTSADSVGAAARSFYDTLMVGAPSPAETVHWLPVPSFPERQMRTEQSRRHRDWPAVGTRILVDESGVALLDGDTARAIDTDEVAGMYVFADGVRHVVSGRGWGLTLDPDQWHSGAKLTQTLDRVVPMELRLPHPAAPRREFRRQRLLRRWWQGMRRARHTDVASWVGIVVFSAMALSGVVLGSQIRPLPVAVGVGMAAVTYAEMAHRKKARRQPPASRS